VTVVDLLSRDFVQLALVAGVVLALLAGLLGPMVVGRGMAFAVHGTAELAFAGGAGALLLFGTGAVGWGALAGAVLVALVFGALGTAARERDSVIGVLLSFGLGLGVLFQSLYTGRSANKFGLLVGQIVGVDTADLITLAITGVAVVGVLAVAYRPLLFASLDPAMARARGVPVRALSIAFAVLLGATVALGVQIVGALLVLSLVITPAAAAARVTASPLLATLLAVLIAEVSVVAGIVASLGTRVPISPFVAGIAFTAYLVCRAVGAVRTRRRAVRSLEAPATAGAS
jgi:zinc/manganese transport system permease protein